MKINFLLLTILILFFSKSLFAEKILEEKLIYRGDIAFSFDTDEPITGKVIQNYDDGKIKFQGEYLEGLKIGEWTEFFEDGNKKAIRNFSIGKKDGFFEIFFNDGKTKLRGEYLGGKENGEWAEHREDGKLIYVGNYKVGELDGRWQNFHDNGRLYSMGFYVDGLKEGLWEYFDKMGVLITTKTFENDETKKCEGFCN